jgi:hypothetical protein
MKALAILALFAIIIGLTMLCGGVVIGIIAAWFLDIPFGVGWDMAWENPWKLALFALVVGPFFLGD